MCGNQDRNSHSVRKTINDIIELQFLSMIVFEMDYVLLKWMIVILFMAQLVLLELLHKKGETYSE